MTLVVITGKAGKAAALPRFPNTLTLSQSGWEHYAKQLALPHLQFFPDYATLQMFPP